MLKFAAVAALGALSALGATQALGALGARHVPASQPSAQMADAASPQAQVATDDPSPASISKSKDGHYWAEADVNGRQVRFLVDTGATEVSLTAADAERLGLSVRDLDYSYAVNTANGQARAARVQLASVSIAGAQVRNVEALVIDRGLPASLLGMTYLGRLSRFEATPTALILRP